MIVKLDNGEYTQQSQLFESVFNELLTNFGRVTLIAVFIQNCPADFRLDSTVFGFVSQSTDCREFFALQSRGNMTELCRTYRLRKEVPSDGILLPTNLHSEAI